MELDLKGILSGMFKELIPELIAEYWGVSTLKKIIGKGKSAKEGSDVATGNTPEIKYGGIFNLSDETAYLGLVSQVDAETRKRITSFINKKLVRDWQKRRFRVIVGSLAETEVITRVRKTPITIPASKGNPASNKEKIEETKISLGLKFLKSFGKHTEDEMLEICQAAGILDSVFEKIQKVINNQEGELGKKMQSAADWMKQDMERRKTSRLTTKLSGIFRR